MESNNIPAEIAEHGDNSPGGSLKSDGELPYYGRGPQSWRVRAMQETKRSNIRQYMTRPIACGKDADKSEPFPSLLESAEQKRRVERNRAKREIATLRANFADWIWSQTEPKPAGSK